MSEERIKEDPQARALQIHFNNGGSNQDSFESGFLAGCQHGRAEARREVLKEVIERLRDIYTDDKYHECARYLEMVFNLERLGAEKGEKG